jgi:hypothetical protein
MYKYFLKKLEDDILRFGVERMKAEVRAYDCLVRALKRACQMEMYPLRELLPPGSVDIPTVEILEYTPALDPRMSKELLWLCPRMTLVESQYVSQLRFKQRYMTKVSNRDSC